MYVLFVISLLGFVATLPLYFISLEHSRLQEKYGQRKGMRLGNLCGMVSGWGFFLFWFGIWFSPQPRFAISALQDFSANLQVLGMPLHLVSILIFLPFFAAGLWFGIRGVKETTLAVAETHRPTKVVTKGVYSVVRHPQYLGGLSAHLGFTFLLSGLYSLLSTPLVVACVYLISRKEELELAKEFGEEYRDYMKRTPMLFPRWRGARV